MQANEPDEQIREIGSPRFCSSCGLKVAPGGAFCARCGARVANNERAEIIADEESSRLSVGAIAGLIAGIVAISLVLGVIGLTLSGELPDAVNSFAPSAQKQATLNLESLKTQAAKDQEQQYHAVERAGSKTDKCVHAGLVAEAYLQAGDNDNYHSWIATRNLDCSIAGLHI